MPKVRKLPRGVFVASAAAAATSSASPGRRGTKATVRAGVTPLEEALARSPAVDDDKRPPEKRGRGRPRGSAKKAARSEDGSKEEQPRRGRPRKVKPEDCGDEKNRRPRGRPKVRASSAAEEKDEDDGEAERATGSRGRPSRRTAGTPNYSDTKRRSRVMPEDEAESSTTQKRSTSRRSASPEKKRGRKKNNSKNKEEETTEEELEVPKPSLAEVMKTPEKEPLPEADLERLLEKIDATKARGARWLSVFERLRSFRSAAGHCNVPMQYPPDQALANWVGLMRKEKKRGKLDEARTELLEGIGFEWSVANKTRRALRESVERLPEGMRKITKHSAENSRRWDEYYSQLKQWKSEHGNCWVPQRPPSGDEQVAKLGKWVSRQRVQYGLMLRGLKSDMTEERIDRLNKLEFSWRRYQKEVLKHHTRLKWSQRLDQLKAFRDKYGNFDVADDDDEFPGLRTFIMNQRNACRKFEAGFTEEANMTQEKLDKLRSIGFSWGTISSSNMSSKSKEYMAELREMNLNSNREMQWEEMFRKLLEYKGEKGDCNIPVHVTLQPDQQHPHKRLSAWVKTQRRQYKLFQAWTKYTEKERVSMKEKPFITEERINRLDEVGFIWIIKKGAEDSDSEEDENVTATPRKKKDQTNLNKNKLWERRFNELLSFKKANGHVNVKVNLAVKEGEEHPHPKLSSWVRTQRRQYWLLQKWKGMSKHKQMEVGDTNKRPVITEERIMRLEEVGFKWKDPESHAKSEEKRKRKAKEASAEVHLDENGQPAKKKRRGGYGRPNDEKWEKMFQQLCEFKSKHGHANVKVKNNTECPVLGTWVKTQRRRYKLINEGKKACLPQHRIEKLESIGFKWVEVGTHWDERFLELLQYVAEHGHANVPNTDGPHRKLVSVSFLFNFVSKPFCLE